MTTLTTFLFVALMSAVIVSDARERRIPNRLTFPAIALGLLLRLPLGPLEVLAGMAGVVVGFAIGIPLFSIGALGGGDVKLLAAIGAFLGPVDLLWTALTAAALGLVVALVVTAAQGVIVPALLGARDLFRWGVSFGRQGRRPDPSSPVAITIPYGIAIAGGALVTFFVPVAQWLR